jgi:uncharacterized protein YcbK (DUF882 family)
LPRPFGAPSLADETPLDRDGSRRVTSEWRPGRRAFLVAAGASLLIPVGARAQASGIRRLKLKNVNTGETFDGPYRDTAGPIPDAIADLAILLRDHHVNKIGPVSIATLDFLADVLDAVGQTRASILSAYRTPETNARLIAFGAAENSQHLLGRALDISLDSHLAEAEIAARQMDRGGVGWYPRSRFVHLDSGPPRSWEMDGTSFGGLLAGGSPGRPLTVRQRIALQRQLARRAFLARQ